MFGAQIALLRAEWAFDLDAIKFGVETGLDFGAGYGYAKVLFGPFQFAIIVRWEPRKSAGDKNKTAQG